MLGWRREYPDRRASTLSQGLCGTAAYLATQLSACPPPVAFETPAPIHRFEQGNVRYRPPIRESQGLSGTSQVFAGCALKTQFGPASPPLRPNNRSHHFHDVLPRAVTYGDTQGGASGNSQGLRRFSPGGPLCRTASARGSSKPDDPRRSRVSRNRHPHRSLRDRRLARRRRHERLRPCRAEDSRAEARHLDQIRVGVGPYAT